ncbi:MerR family transcriptional regulator [Maricaulaceae bacterium MS644]
MTEKSADAYRTISEAGEEAGLPAHVLRFWESKFTQLKPVKRAGGRRLYRPQDVQLLKGLRRLLYEEGYTIKGAQKYLKDHGVAHVSGLGEGGTPSDVPGARVSNAQANAEHEADARHTRRGEIEAGEPHGPERRNAVAASAHDPGLEAGAHAGLDDDDRARLRSALDRLRGARHVLGAALQTHG